MLFLLFQQFPMRGSECYNYRFGHSLILFAVADAKYKFIVVDVGSRGRESDGGVFDRSEFGELFNQGLLQFPEAVYYEEINARLPIVLLGDDAFPFHEHLMKPFPFDISGKPEEVVYNYRLSRARRVVENAFGILTARWRILRKNIVGSETLAQNVILACTALHNLHLQREDSIPSKQKVYLPKGYADTYKTNGKLKKGRWRNEVKHDQDAIYLRLLQEAERGTNLETADDVREKLVEYFIKKPVPWQWDVLP